MSKSNSLPIGPKEVQLFADGNFDISDLGLPEDFAQTLAGHSFQYNFDAAKSSPFWETVVTAAGMKTVSI